MGKAGKSESESSRANKLRRKAEEQLRGSKPAEGMAATDARTLIHELRAHQIELEMQNENGLPECRTVLSDINERKRAEVALRQANERLRIYERLVERSPDSVAVIDREYVYRMANASFLGRHKKQLEEILGHTVEDVLGKANFERLRPYIDQCFTGREVHFGDWFVYRDLGPRFLEISYYPLPDECGLADLVVADLHDATDRKRAQEAFNTSEARYRRLFEDATEGIVLVDATTGEILDYNQAFSQLSGFDRLELIGKPQAVLHPVDQGNPTVSRTFAQHRVQRDGAVLADDLVTKAGGIRRVEIKANVLEIDGRKVMQGFFRDVTVEARYHHERETTLKLLRLLNDPNNTHELVRSLTGFLQQWTGCEAVGIRLPALSEKTGPWPVPASRLILQ